MKPREPKFPEWAGMGDFGGTDFPDIDYSTRLFDAPIVQEHFKPGFGDSVDVPVDYVCPDVVYVSPDECTRVYICEDDCKLVDAYTVSVRDPVYLKARNDGERFSTKQSKR